LEALADVARGARERGVPVHLDGARLWNASVATGTPLSAYAAYADSVSVCFSKGLGAPIGSCLCGPADFITEARAVRASCGGRMRQVGIVAAAALYALEHNIERLADDHRRARELTVALDGIDGLAAEPPDTNIVMVDVTAPGLTAPRLEAALRERGVGVVAVGPARVRAVTHLDVDDAGIARAVDAFQTAVTARA
jgi:threonine aldolase